MTPERAMEIATSRGYAPGTEGRAAMVAAILAACLEQERETRRAVWTEAAEVCRAGRQYPEGYGIVRDYDDACSDCARAIERLRASEPTNA